MRAVLDACVLYPTVLRGILIGAAKAGFLTPIWSERILEEWARAALRTHGPEGESMARAEIALLRAEWPKALVGIETERDLPELPDKNDQHVLAACVSSNADSLITHNLRDFPTRKLSPLGIAPQHPDPVMLRFWQDNPEPILTLIDDALAKIMAVPEAPKTRRALLKKAGLPRLGKAVERFEAS